MRINCKDLDCPDPVIRTKKALESLGDDAILEIELNSVSSVENCKRFGESQSCEVRIEVNGDETLMTLIKGYPCDVVAQEKPKSNTVAKTIFIKTESIGNGELGKKLMNGFLKTTLELDTLPKNIIFVNEGVKLTTQPSEIVDSLIALESKGVEIYSCGLCMNHFEIPPESLLVGHIGNAYDTMRMLMETDVVSL